MEKNVKLFLAVASFLFAMQACNSKNENTQKRKEMSSETDSFKNTTWVISNYKITVNGTNFFGNGVCYSPIPWGACPGTYPYGDYTINTWNSIWQRDLDSMRNYGINLLKTYNTIDSAQLAPEGQTGWDHDHAQFLSACWNNGQQPIYVLMGYAPPKNNAQIFYASTWNNPLNIKERANIKSSLIKLAKKYASSPALMGFVMANEINSNLAVNDSAFFQYWNDVAIAIQTAAPGKLVSLANVDDGMITVNNGNQYITATNYFWGYNSYRGNWTNSNGFDVLFSTYATATSTNPKPLMLTEWGAPASTHISGNIQNMNINQMNNLVKYVTGHYKYMIDSGKNVCCGGTYFEWTDELCKADPIQCNATDAYPACYAGLWNPGPNMNPLPQFPGNYWDEEGFGLFSIKPVDTASRTPVTNSGCLGPWNQAAGKPYAPDSITIRPHAKALFNLYQQH